jgi:TRAP-type C4-dicarboxylate transport system substrate-binding protein
VRIESEKERAQQRLGGTAGMVFMNNKKYQALPDGARKIIDDNSGEAQSRAYGKFWDDVSNEGGDLVIALGTKRVIVSLPPAIEASWRQKILPVTDDWAETTPDGEKVLAAFRAIPPRQKPGTERGTPAYPQSSSESSSPTPTSPSSSTSA